MQQGCGAIPLDRPLLLVSNHQTYALDIGPLIEGLLRQTDLLPRGLTHPAVFQVRLSSLPPPVPPPQGTVSPCLLVASLCACTSNWTVLLMMLYVFRLFSLVVASSWPVGFTIT